MGRTIAWAYDHVIGIKHIATRCWWLNAVMFNSGTDECFSVMIPVDWYTLLNLSISVRIQKNLTLPTVRVSQDLSTCMSLYSWWPYICSSTEVRTPIDSLTGSSAGRWSMSVSCCSYSANFILFTNATCTGSECTFPILWGKAANILSAGESLMHLSKTQD